MILEGEEGSKDLKGVKKNGVNLFFKWKTETVWNVLFEKVDLTFYSYCKD